MREENLENNRQYYDEYEIDLREYIILLWQKKWFVLGLVILAILAALFYNLFFVQPVYEARATLLILPPRYTTSLEVKTFSADTYENLAQTDSIKAKIIADLSLKNREGEEYSVDQLGDMMKVKLLSAAEEDSTPLIQLIVKNRDPELAAQIANSWAKLFMADSKEIRKSEVTEISSVIQQQFEETENKLKGLKTQKLNFKEKNRLELLNKELSNKEDKLTSINQKVLDLKSELGFKKIKLTNLEKQLSKLEDDGNWEGDLSYNKKASDSAADYQQLKNKQRFLNSQQKLVEFNQENNLGLLKLKIKNKEEKIISYQAKIAELENNLTTAIQENKHLEQFLKTESKTWQLNKSIDNQTLWQSILNQKDLAILDKLKLKNEIVIPFMRIHSRNLLIINLLLILTLI
jgi:capsular polysaccharide biosynthesis protein